MTASTRYLLIPVLGDIQEHGCPGVGHSVIKWIKGTIGHHFDEHFERVNVLYCGEYRDMFVGETSSINGRHIRNIRATAIYRANALGIYQGLYLHDPDPARCFNVDPESLPAISGPAVLFPDYQVWR